MNNLQAINDTRNAEVLITRSNQSKYYDLKTNKWERLNCIERLFRAILSNLCCFVESSKDRCLRLSVHSLQNACSTLQKNPHLLRHAKWEAFDPILFINPNARWSQLQLRLFTAARMALTQLIDTKVRTYFVAEGLSSKLKNEKSSAADFPEQLQFGVEQSRAYTLNVILPSDRNIHVVFQPNAKIKHLIELLKTRAEDFRMDPTSLLSIFKDDDESARLPKEYSLLKRIQDVTYSKIHKVTPPTPNQILPQPPEDVRNFIAPPLPRSNSAAAMSMGDDLDPPGGAPMRSAGNFIPQPLVRNNTASSLPREDMYSPEHAPIRLASSAVSSSAAAAAASAVVNPPNASGMLNTIYVQTITGKTLNIDIDQNASVETLKKRIAELEGINPEAQRLLFAGKAMEDNRSLNEYYISGDSRIHLVSRMRGGPANSSASAAAAAATATPPQRSSTAKGTIRLEDKTYILKLKNQKDETLNLEIDQNETVGKLKKRIAEMQGVDPNTYQLISQMKVLDDERSLNEYKFESGLIAFAKKRDRSANSASAAAVNPHESTTSASASATASAQPSVAIAEPARAPETPAATITPITQSSMSIAAAALQAANQNGDKLFTATCTRTQAVVMTPGGASVSFTLNPDETLYTLSIKIKAMYNISDFSYGPCIYDCNGRAPLPVYMSLTELFTAQSTSININLRLPQGIHVTKPLVGDVKSNYKG